MNDFIKNFSCIGTGVLVAEVVTIPVCTIKTVYQTFNHKTIRESLKYIYEKNGMKGFFKSAPIASTSQIISQSSKYALFYLFLKEKATFTEKVICGIGAGVTVSLIAHPVDICRVIIQRNESIRKELLNHGIKRFYFGITTNWAKVIISSSCFMPIFELVKGSFNAFQSSIITATISTIIMHPVDYMKTMKMANKQIEYSRTMFTKGLSIHLLRIIPHFVISMTIADYLKNKQI